MFLLSLHEHTRLLVGGSPVPREARRRLHPACAGRGRNSVLAGIPEEKPGSSKGEECTCTKGEACRRRLRQRQGPATEACRCRRQTPAPTDGPLSASQLLPVPPARPLPGSMLACHSKLPFVAPELVCISSAILGNKVCSADHHAEDHLWP